MRRRYLDPNRQGMLKTTFFSKDQKDSEKSRQNTHSGRDAQLTAPAQRGNSLIKTKLTKKVEDEEEDFTRFLLVLPLAFSSF